MAHFQSEQHLLLKGTWQWDGFSGVFAGIGSSLVPYTTFRAVPILASNSRRYLYWKKDSPLSQIRGVTKSPHHWYGESPIPRITDTRSRRVAYWIFLKKTLRIDDTESRQLPTPVIRWVAVSPYCWVRELPTPRITNTESRRLRVSPIRRVDDSAYHWVGESTTPRIGDKGSRYSKKKLIWCWFSELLTAKPCL